ncbi:MULTISPECIES: hypothetical protein [Streptomyces]|uniref:Nucleopolyhedrovirus P10 family protein n=2 Tax=Streptomyces TaxID=1883 RepID=A0ABU2R4V6_9ACTN|nr:MULTISPECIES: hypothetical protein [unclassified Streptomyces]ASY35606.1 hypothetical protein CAC01_25390 [Streptomyces sp. CLI2509]EGJ78313.1 hypothetical protein STTU_5526 [Streptomyces sp. Tu6071]MDT0411731.1 hypothetical protein [Streptomyces sp. DSM 41979]MYQ59445.1 hypothetical protein [Streptomyces sp. SID4926]
MTERRWDRTVRDQLALGRLLPLAGAPGGAWLTESAASAALRRTGEGVPGAELVKVSFTAAGEEGAAPGGGFPAPATAPPPGPLVLTATCGVHARGALTEVTDALRAALARTARDGLGLDVAAVDLRVAELLDEAPEPAPRAEEASGGDTEPGGDGEEAAVGRAVLAVPGVAGLARRFGTGGRAVRLGTAADGARAVRVELTASGGRPLPGTVGAVREAAAGVLGAGTDVAVLVTGWRG